MKFNFVKILFFKVVMFLSLHIYINFAYSANENEYLVLDIYEHKFKKTKVPVFLSLPKDSSKQPFPLIITQHGSETKIKFPIGNGKQMNTPIDY